MMDFHKIQTSDFQAVVDLLNISFPVNRAFIERDLKETQKSPKENGDIYGLWVDGWLVGTATYGACYDKEDDEIGMAKGVSDTSLYTQHIGVKGMLHG